MQYYFSNHFSKNLYQSKVFVFSFFVLFVLTSSQSWAISPIISPLDTTLIIEKDIYPKIVDRQERLIEGKKYVFATVNERKGMVALSGNFLSEMARAAGVEVTDFLDWNDMKPTDPVKTGQVYYLQEKGNRAKDVATHVLMDKETLWDVSQKYAMRYKYLLKYNRLDDDDKVKVGRVLWIQTKRPKRIPVEVRDVTPIVANFDDNETEEEAADPELMAEWEELKKTELAGMDKNKDDKNTDKKTTTVVKTDNSDKTQQGSFAEFEDETEGVIITEKKDTNKDVITTNTVKYHTVAEAESLYDISKKYNVVMTKLKEWNNLADYTTYTGQKIIVSQPNKMYDAALVTEKKEDNKQTTTTNSDKKVVVKQNANGDFVSFIDSSGILLPIPQQDFRPIQPNLNSGDKNYHIVEQDETLWSIARKYNLSPKNLILWNGFVTGDNIDIGDKIILNSALAVAPGSRVETIKNNTSSGSSTSTNNTTEGTKFQDPALIDPATSNGVNNGQSGANTPNTDQKSASGYTREYIISNGGNPDKAGTKGYDAMGFEVTLIDADTIKTKTVETETKAQMYVVQPKDMLGKIAQKYGTTTKEMMVWNPKIPANGIINIGDTLFVSQPKKTITVVENTQQTATIYPFDYYGAGFHAVQANETTYALSEKYGVPVAKIRSWNNIFEDDLPVGKKMIISEGALKMANSNKVVTPNQQESTNPTAQVNYSYHSVAKGETLFSIAQKYNLSTAQLREWNNRQGDLVYENEKLIIGIK